MRILVPGAGGFIGHALSRALGRAGYDVVGMGRQPTRPPGHAHLDQWVQADISLLCETADWLPHLQDIDCVVNASGALQDGPRDNLERLQYKAVAALIDACETGSVTRFVQISAPGADPAAETAFLATKGRADLHLSMSDLDWVILKPGLVIGNDAYGGTALLRALAGFPWIQPLVLPDAPVQSIALDDLADAVCRAVQDEAVTGNSFDLMEAVPVRFAVLVAAMRESLGFRAPLWTFHLPAWTANLAASLSDLAGLLGWRAPMRSTALKVMQTGIVGDSAPWTRLTGQSFRPLPDILSTHPGTRQDRQFARAQLLLPAFVVGFALFWIISGLIGLWQLPRAAALFHNSGPSHLAEIFVGLGCLADMLIGGLLLHRRSLGPACLLAIIVSLAYLAGATIWLPGLWADPLGPLVKVVPVVGLSLAILATGSER